MRKLIQSGRSKKDRNYIDRNKNKNKRNDDVCNSDNNYLTEEIEDSDFDNNSGGINADSDGS